MDAFTQDLGLIGVPILSVPLPGGRWQQTLNNMTVEANPGSGSSITTGTGLSGNIEFWGNNYGTTATLGGIGGSSSIYDWNDDPNFGSSYGSMQIHNWQAGETLFALNRFATVSKDLGIGNNTGNDHKDWTFMVNSQTYSTTNLEVFVLDASFQPGPIIPEPSTFILFLVGILGFSGYGYFRKHRKTA
jgi:sialate O-acetylesterase